MVLAAVAQLERTAQRVQEIGCERQTAPSGSQQSGSVAMCHDAKQNLEKPMVTREGILDAIRSCGGENLTVNSKLDLDCGQPPYTENGTCGGVGEVAGAIRSPRPDLFG